MDGSSVEAEWTSPLSLIDPSIRSQKEIGPFTFTRAETFEFQAVLSNLVSVKTLTFSLVVQNRLILWPRIQFGTETFYRLSDSSYFTNCFDTENCVPVFNASGKDVK